MQKYHLMRKNDGKVQNFFTVNLQTQNATQPCLYDAHRPLTVHLELSGLETTFSLEIIILLAERHRNNRILQMSVFQRAQLCQIIYFIKFIASSGDLGSVASGPGKVRFPTENLVRGTCCTAGLLVTQSERKNRTNKGRDKCRNCLPGSESVSSKVLSDTRDETHVKLKKSLTIFSIFIHRE